MPSEISGLWEKQITALCLRNLPELRKKIITLNSILAFCQNRRLPGWAVGLSEWAGNLLPSIISPVPAKKAVFTFSNGWPFLASLCFGCPQLSPGMSSAGFQVFSTPVISGAWRPSWSEARVFWGSAGVFRGCQELPDTKRQPRSKERL